jgi:hypothetical protein
MHPLWKNYIMAPFGLQEGVAPVTLDKGAEHSYTILTVNAFTEKLFSCAVSTVFPWGCAQQPHLSFKGEMQYVQL